MASLLWLKWGGGNSIEQTWHLTKKWCRQMPASIKNRCHFTWFQRIPPSYLECQVLFGSSPHGFYFVSFSRFPACGFMCFEPFAFLVAFLCLPFVFPALVLSAWLCAFFALPWEGFCASSIASGFIDGWFEGILQDCSDCAQPCAPCARLFATSLAWVFCADAFKHTNKPANTAICANFVDVFIIKFLEK